MTRAAISQDPDSQSQALDSHPPWTLTAKAMARAVILARPWLPKPWPQDTAQAQGHG